MRALEKKIATFDFAAGYHPACEPNGLTANQVGQQDQIKLEGEFLGTVMIKTFNQAVLRVAPIGLMQKRYVVTAATLVISNSGATAHLTHIHGRKLLPKIGIDFAGILIDTPPFSTQFTCTHGSFTLQKPLKSFKSFKPSNGQFVDWSNWSIGYFVIGAMHNHLTIRQIDDLTCCLLSSVLCRLISDL
jgi:hypothetical protein